MKTVLIIGAGATGSICASLLAKKLSTTLKIIMWDKGRNAGGRMTTKGGADLGAQYISTTKEKLENYAQFYDPLLENNLLTPLTDKSSIIGLKNSHEATLHFVPPQGTNEIVKHFLKDVTCVNYEKCVVKITPTNFKKYKVSTNDEEATVDFIISTIPIPQFIPLIELNDQEELEQLKNVQYSSRFVLVWCFNKNIIQKKNWSARYVDNDDTIRYISLEHQLKSRNNQVVLFHSTVAFGLEHKEENKEDAKGLLEDAAKRLLPDWPIPDQTHVHKWKFSQIYKGFNSGKGCYELKNYPGIILAGDAFTQSNLNGCIESAEAAFEEISRQLLL